MSDNAPACVPSAVVAGCVRDFHVLKAAEDVGFVRDQLVDGGPGKGGALCGLEFDPDDAALELEFILQELANLEVLAFRCEVILELPLDRSPVSLRERQQSRGRTGRQYRRAEPPATAITWSKEEASMRGGGRVAKAPHVL